MDIELRALSLKDGEDVFNMLKEMPAVSNGFYNTGYEISREEFSSYLMENYNCSKGIDIKKGYVPQTMYWLYVDGKIVGIGKLRHYLNDNLRKEGGHIGYGLLPKEIGKGYGSILLRELLKEAKKIGVKEALLTCNTDNIPSKKVIERNGGKLQDIFEDKYRYWIEL